MSQNPGVQFVLISHNPGWPAFLGKVHSLSAPVQGGGENMQGADKEELPAQGCAPGPGPRYSDLCGVKKCQQSGGTTHHLQMTAPSCEKLTLADRELRGEYGMPPT